MELGLRPSQFITTFGPGALVETPQGPFILCDTKEALLRIGQNGIQMQDLEIRDPLLEQGILDGAHIFRLPDEVVSDRFRYPTKRFPTWNHCEQHGQIYRNDIGCSACKGPQKSLSKTNKFASRFLMACPNGHLDDVPWRALVHAQPGQERTDCNPDFYLWRGSGATLRSITISCPKCGISKALSEIYSSKPSCRGRRPEISGGDKEECNQNALVVQRGSFQLRLPQVFTSLSIPPFTTGLHVVLLRTDVQAILDAVEGIGLNEENFKNAVENSARKSRIPPKVAAHLKSTPWSKIVEVLNDINSSAKRLTKLAYLEREHKALMQSAESGFPPLLANTPRKSWESSWFEVDVNSIENEIKGPERKLVFRVMPIETLRVVLVQTGFRRVDYTSKDFKPTSCAAADLENPDMRWVPGVAQLGEGIFIELNPDIQSQRNWTPQGPAAKEWASGKYFAPSDTDLIAWSPLAIWWHSFSHRVINALSLHSGYSSSAIRERIYMSKRADGTEAGGVLLYTTQPGGDGTLGGLTSLVPDFEQILKIAFENIDSCSNDPICGKSQIEPISKLGAVCYSCQIVSETSCEHFNSHLDRRIVLENMP